MVWRDRDVELTWCPVLAFTPEVTEINRWFAATHRIVQMPDGRATWERFALPTAGGAGEQDARLLAALDFLLAMKTTLLLRGAPSREAELSAFHDAQRHEL